MSHSLGIGLGAAAAVIVVYLFSLWRWPWRSCDWCRGQGDCSFCDHGRKYRLGARTIARVTRSTRI